MTYTLEQIKTVTYAAAEQYFRNGLISETTWDEYCHLWQSSAPRFSLRACSCETCRRLSPAWEPL